MNRLSTEKRSQIVRCLVEGNSIRSTVRITGASKNTIAKLLIELGQVCTEYQDRAMMKLGCERVQLDEIWSFCYAKDKNVPLEYQNKPGYGSVWTWTALCADSKLIISWLVGDRDAAAAERFLYDLAYRFAGRVQITSDGLGLYQQFTPGAFGGKVDFAQLIKVYGGPEKTGDVYRRYSPAKCIGARSQVVTGNPDPKHINTSYVERQNLTMRMSMRRFTRLTNGFSKKFDNHCASVALHFMHYNFCRIHKTLRTTPAMEAGVTDRLWDVADIVGLLEARENSN